MQPDDPTEVTKPTPPLRRARTVVAVALVMLLAAEGGVRLIAHKLPEPQDWYHPEVQRRADFLDRANARHRPIPVVFVGSSSVGTALNPREFTRVDACARAAFNAAAPSAGPSVDKHWIEDEILPKAHPKVIVLGLTSRDLAFGDTLVALGPYLNSRALRHDTFARVARWLAGRSYLVKYGSVLRDPHKLWEVVRRVRTFDETHALGLSADGFGYRYPQYPYRPASPSERALVAHFRIDQQELAVVARTIDELRAQGVKVVIANLPVTDEWRSIHEGGARTYNAYVRTLGNMTRAHNAQFVDLAPVTHDEREFIDPVHLARVGSVQVTDRLAAALAGTCRS